VACNVLGDACDGDCGHLASWSFVVQTKKRPARRKREIGVRNRS
jgi:hypothetical protein